VPWIPLGTVSPEIQWQQFSAPLLGGPWMFRFTHQWIHRPYGFAAFCQEFYEGTWGYRRLYPVQNRPLLIRLDVPTELTERGIVAWYPSIKLGGYTRRFDGDGWLITVEVLQN